MAVSEELHAVASEPESWLAEAAAAPARSLGLPPEEELAAGTKVGQHYEIEGVLGSGGMGVVYRALDHSLDRSVALKLHHWSDEHSRDRLLREARVMAKLSHPNVLAVHEVGTWGEHVYLAAELVEGMTARRWHKGEHGWREVVALYLKAGAGLAAAHRGGLVHRDFKPDNVLVGDDGRVRVADFGLARAVGPLGESSSSLSGLASGAVSTSGPLAVLTRTGARVGTPAYMAPEQFLGEELDGRADQFAFCVSLYEGLFHRRPFRGKSVAALAASIGRGPTMPNAERRVPRGVRRVLVRGLKAEPDDRFASMDELLVALEHSVRAPRRIGWGVGAVAVAAAGIVALRAGTPQCDDVRAGIDAVWSDARRTSLADRFAASAAERQEYERVSTKVTGFAERWAQTRETICAERVDMTEGLADRGYACLDDAARQLDATLARLEATSAAGIGIAHESLAHLVQPRECVDAAFLLAEVAPPTDLEARPQIASLRSEVAKFRVGAWDTVDAPQVFARLDAIEAEAEALGYLPLTAEVHLTRAMTVLSTEEAKHAIPLLEDAFFKARAVGHRRDTVSAARMLAQLQGLTLGRTEPGLLWARHAATEAGRGGVNLAMVAATDHTLAMLKDEAGAWDEASAAYRRALERTQPDDELFKPLRAAVLTSLAGFEAARGEVDKGLAAGAEALALLKEIHGPEHQSMVPVISNVAYALAEVGRYAESRDWAERGVGILTRVYGERSRRLPASLINVANAEQGLGNFDEARAVYASADSILREAFGPIHPDIALIANNLADMAIEEGDLDGAAQRLSEAIDVLEQTLGPRAPATLRAQANLADANLRRDQLSEACPVFTTVVEALEELGGELRVQAMAMRGQADCALRRGEVSRAIALLRAALEVAERGAMRPEGKAQIERSLADALWAQDPRAGAEAHEAVARARTHYKSVGNRSSVDALDEWVRSHPRP